MSWELGHELDSAGCLEALAAVAGAEKDNIRAARLWGVAEGLREAVGGPISPSDLNLLQPYLTRARERLGETAWQEALADGRGMTREDVISFALQRSWLQKPPVHKP